MEPLNDVVIFFAGNVVGAVLVFVGWRIAVKSIQIGDKPDKIKSLKNTPPVYDESESIYDEALRDENKERISTL